MCNSYWGGVTSCNFWHGGGSSGGGSGSSGGSVSGGGSGNEWAGFLWIDPKDENSIWWAPLGVNGRETLTADKTYTLHAGFQWGATPADMESPVTVTEAQEKAASADAIAVSGVTISWTVDNDPDGAVASIVPSADTHTCAVTIDYSKLKTAPYSSTVAIKASITSALGDGLDSWGMNHQYYLGTGSYGYYFLLEGLGENYVKNDTATVYLSK